ncbi:MAG TPA: cation diffusion facilitator family transporter [Chloroflexia bacterium]|nr:cation diffusion facilitator family transporter [Chloroflexia bacterium]
MDSPSLKREQAVVSTEAKPKPSAKNKVIYLSIGAAITTITLKFAAYFLTGSVGLLSDAMESMVNLVGASAALVALIIAARPADKTHHYGHTKIEYFSSGLEGGLILVAAVAIAWTAIGRLFEPEALESVGFGLAVSLAATVVNLVVARVLLRVGREEDSITLEADGKHLMTDVVTSIGVIIGVVLVTITGWLWLDPVIALLVAANIIFEGSKLVKRSIDGLIDRALPQEEEGEIRDIIKDEIGKAEEKQLTYHGLRTRKSGSLRFIDFHLLTPAEWSVRQAHEVAETIETKLEQQFKELEITIHIEPVDDPRAYEDNWEDNSGSTQH